MARTSVQPLRVGILISQSGVTALTERTQLNGTMLALNEVNRAGGVLGRPLEPVVYDPASDPDAFRTYAERLLHVDRVRFIFGCYMSSERKAVLPAIDGSNALLFYPTMYEGFEFSNNIIYSGAAPNQNNVSLLYYLFQNYGKRFYLIGSDYTFPRESNRIFSDLARSMGGEVLAERYLPLTAQTADFEEQLKEIRNLRPDAIFSTIVGQSVVHFYRGYRKIGLRPSDVPIASLNTSEAEIQVMGPEAAEGHLMSAPYFESVDRPQNLEFVKSYRSAFGSDAPITSCTEAAYFQVKLLAEAVEKAGTTDTVTVRNKLMGAEFEAPQGRVRIDPDNSHTHLWSRIGQVDSCGLYRVIQESNTALKPDPYLVLPTPDNRATLNDPRLLRWPRHVQRLREKRR